MREYKFRGRTEDGEWIYGNLIGKDVIVGPIVEWDSEYFNTEFWYKVDPETVGQYTGLKDEEGTEMFDGDHLWAPGNFDDDLQYVGEIEWDEADARWEVSNFHGRFEYIPNGCVVRNDTPHLLEQGEKT